MTSAIHHALRGPAARSTVPCLCAAALAGAASLATAQGSVTLYGRIVSGVDYMNRVAEGPGRSSDQLRHAGQWGATWWGLRGSEDLGGGLSAVFHLESQFSADDGMVGDSFFSRYAVVGLRSQTYGTLLLGRAMGIPDGEVWALDPMGLQAMGAGTLQGNRTWGSRPNAISYQSPAWGGLSFRAQLGLNGEAGRSRAGRQVAASVGYEQGPLVLKAFYEEIRDGNGAFSSLYTASRLYTVGATYRVGGLKLFTGYSQIRSGALTVADADNPAGARRQQTYWMGANYQATPALVLVGGAYRANRSGGGASLVSLGANYHLSRRTMLYGTVGTLSNGGTASFSVEANSGKPLPGSGQQGLYAGVVHSF
ncbi:porin [Delftia acidovorans]|uniref:porin n=1 Tax=Delftia acidovorans TaxID=80866 RepID=UPI000BCF313D|nr:porin [Delftia acidovorans]SOE36911.1 Outer membrane protein (porin) [Delftia acidovorans]